MKLSSALGENEKRLLTQLRNNRQTASLSVHADLKKEFISKMFSDKQLIKCIKIVGRNNFIVAESRLVLLEYALRRSITTRGFSERLIVFYNTNPEIIIKIMLHNISFT